MSYLSLEQKWIGFMALLLLNTLFKDLSDFIVGSGRPIHDAI
jgi:hypothetical protein